jgi:hypothetical protein
MKSRGIALLIACIAVAAMLVCLPNADAGSLNNATSASIGVAGRWLYDGEVTGDREVEGIGNVAVSVTRHLSVTGGLAYGFNDAYSRSQADVRITATDADNPRFNVWFGAGRYWTKDEANGLDEFAGKAGVGWVPMDGKPFVLGLTAAHGLDTGREQVSASLVFAFKRARGNQ